MNGYINGFRDLRGDNSADRTLESVDNIEERTEENDEWDSGSDYDEPEQSTSTQ